MQLTVSFLMTFFDAEWQRGREARFGLSVTASVHCWKLVSSGTSRGGQVTRAALMVGSMLLCERKIIIGRVGLLFLFFFGAVLLLWLKCEASSKDSCVRDLILIRYHLEGMRE